VFDNVAYGLKLRKIGNDEIGTRVTKALEQLSLGHLGERFPHQLSGGQQQRVALARALVYNPPVILLDEPLSNLDAKLREEARAWLRELIVRMQLSALCVTHDQSEALAMSDRILLLNNGRIEQQGTPEQMYSDPVTLFTADFMGSNNKLSGRVTDVRDGAALLEGDGWKLWGTARSSAKTGADGTGMIRLERIRLSDGPGENRLEAGLTTSMYLGDKWEHLFALGESRLRAYGDKPLASGRHWLEVPRESLWVF
jgi:iron(III) transport system ATP-binding protein